MFPPVHHTVIASMLNTRNTSLTLSYMLLQNFNVFFLIPVLVGSYLKCFVILLSLLLSKGEGIIFGQNLNHRPPLTLSIRFKVP